MPLVHLVIRTWMGRPSYALDWEPNLATDAEVNAGRARRVAVSRDIATCCGLRGVILLYQAGALK